MATLATTLIVTGNAPGGPEAGRGVHSGSAGRGGTPAQFKGHRTGDQAWQWKYRAWMPGHWQRLGACESGSSVSNLNFSFHGDYDGVFGFAYGTWDSFKPVSWWPDDAWQATPFQQYRVALIVAARYGIAEPWGCWRGSEHAWVRGGLPEYGVYR